MIEEINKVLHKIVLNIIKSKNINVNIHISRDFVKKLVKFINNDINKIIKLFVHKFLFPNLIKYYFDIEFHCDLLYNHAYPLPKDHKTY